MDRVLNPRVEKQSIYEIYRACRLCGAGAGYKMPIIQNVVDLDDQEIQLKQKIRECVQIEVHQDDKMPPLICELCVDKVNDFYEFLDMCRQTNIRTRLRLGLPPQSMPRGAPDAGDCILGVTEPVYVNSDSDGEPLSKHKKTHPSQSQKSKVKKAPELRIKLENYSTKTEPRVSRKAKREPTPPRVTRQARTSRDPDNVTLSKLNHTTKPSRTDSKQLNTTKMVPKSILKREVKTENTSLHMSRLKRPRDRDIKSEAPSKKVKISVQAPPRPAPRLKPPTRPPKPLKPPPVPPRAGRCPPSPQARALRCGVCKTVSKTSQGHASHMRSHTVDFTSPKLACNACGLWFVSSEETQTHHRQHKSKGQPYTCRRCTADFKHQVAYDEHFDKKQCIPEEIVPDVKCEKCWQEFPTNRLLEVHKCPGTEGRPGGKCHKCNKSYSLLRNLKRHEKSCAARKKGELVVDPALLGRLKPIQVRVARCDPLLSNVKQEHYDVSTVSSVFGLDRNCVYPYISSVSSLGIKSEPEEFDHMVSIKQEVKEEFCTEENFVHWDSDSETDSEPEITNIVLNPFGKRKRIDSLSTLSLKTIFSQRFLGKVPKSYRKFKSELGFDSLLGNGDAVRRGISNIIDNLRDDDVDDRGVGDDKNVSDDTTVNVSNDSGKDGNDLTLDVSNESSKDGNDTALDVSIESGKDVDTDKNVSNDKVLDACQESSESAKGVNNDAGVDVINDGSRKDVINDNAVYVSTDNIAGNVASNDTTAGVSNDISKSRDNLSENDGHSSSNGVINDTPLDVNNDLKENVEKDINMDASNDLSKNRTMNVENNDISLDDQFCNESIASDTTTSKKIDLESSPNKENVVISLNISPEHSFPENGGDSELRNRSKHSDTDMNEVSNCNDIKNIKSDDRNYKLNSNASNKISTEINDRNATNSTLNDNNVEDKTQISGRNATDLTNIDKNESLQHKEVKNENTDGANNDIHNNSGLSRCNSNEQISINNDKDFNDDDTRIEASGHNEDINNLNCENDLTNKESNDREINEPYCKNESTHTLNNDRNTTNLDCNDKPSAVNDKISLQNKNNDMRVSSEEDDRKLMEDLDAQIGENSGNNERNYKSNKINDKITLEDLIAAKDGDNSLGLDSISDDDFNFDN